MSWPLLVIALVAAALALGFHWYDRTHPSSRTLALVATLAALAALGRVAFAPIPSVKPTTDIVLLGGFVLGAAPGFVIGAVAALASNLFFGQGPWTPFQMGAWGLVGLAGAALGALSGRRLGRVPLALACGAAGLGFGLVMDVAAWVNYGGGSRGQLLFTLGRGVPFNLAHAAGNVLFCLAFGPLLVRALLRFRARSEVVWRPAGATLAAVVAALVLVAVAAPRAEAATPLEFLRGAQNADGGFGGARGTASSALYSSWAAMGLAAAGVRPDARLVAALRRDARTVTGTGDVERTILALRAAGAPADDLVARLLRARRPDGSFDGLVNLTAFGIFALRASGWRAGDPAVRDAARWIARQQNRDGGFSFATRGGPSGVDDTAAAAQGLVAAGRRATPTVRRAVAFLVRRQGADGGFPLGPGQPANAQSTAWVVQALVAARRDPARVRRRGSRTPLGYLRSLVSPDGSVRYSRTRATTPVWVTAQALTALARRPFPIAAPPVPASPRRARRARPAGAPETGASPEAARAVRPPLRFAARARMAGTATAALLRLAGLH